MFSAYKLEYGGWQCRCGERVSRGESIYSESHDRPSFHLPSYMCRACFGDERMKELAVSALKGEEIYR